MDILYIHRKVYGGTEEIHLINKSLTKENAR